MQMWFKISNTSRNPTPSKNPIDAGTNAILPCPSAILIDGINKDHTEVAIITPEGCSVTWTVAYCCLCCLILCCIIGVCIALKN